MQLTKLGIFTFIIFFKKSYIELIFLGGFLNYFSGKWIEIGGYVFQSGEITRAWNDWWSYSRHVHHIYGDPWSIHHRWGYQSFVRRQGNALFWFRWVRNVWFRFHGKNYYVHHLFFYFAALNIQREFMCCLKSDFTKFLLFFKIIVKKIRSINRIE